MVTTHSHQFPLSCIIWGFNGRTYCENKIPVFKVKRENSDLAVYMETNNKTSTLYVLLHDKATQQVKNQCWKP